MYKNLLGWLGAIVLLPSCAGNAPSISIVGEENNVGNCIIRWETTPEIEGKVKFYASTSPDKILEKNPVAIADIKDQRITIVPPDPTKRYYYRVVFNNRYKLKTATRNVNIPGVQNFRDMGGYSTAKKKKIRWGMLFRSGEMDNLGCSARKELTNIGIKTIVDLRSDGERREKELAVDSTINVIHIPIGAYNINEILRGLRDGEIRNDSINNLMLRINRDLVTYYRTEYRKVFNVLLEKDNYPLVIYCSTGKGRTAIASALVLSVLGVNDDVMLYDYRLSNRYFDIPRSTSFGYSLSTKSQEAITTLFSARESFINAAIGQIEKNYGDMATYLERGLNITPDEVKQLKGILLE